MSKEKGWPWNICSGQTAQNREMKIRVVFALLRQTFAAYAK